VTHNEEDARLQVTRSSKRSAQGLLTLSTPFRQQRAGLQAQQRKLAFRRHLQFGVGKKRGVRLSVCMCLLCSTNCFAAQQA